MRHLPEEVRFSAAGSIGYGVARALFSTIRFERESAHHHLDVRQSGGAVIFVLWHDQLLPLVHAHRDEGVVALVSEHADGEYLARVLDRYGFGTVRGSSTRGGARGLRKLLRAAREGCDLAITADGPRGPRHRIKEGALVASQLSGLPLVPVAGAASSGWRFDSWDRFLVPRPFAKVRVVYGCPRTVPRGASRDERTRMVRELEAVLGDLTERANGCVGSDQRAEVEVDADPDGRSGREETSADLTGPQPRVEDDETDRGRKEDRASSA